MADFSRNQARYDETSEEDVGGGGGTQHTSKVPKYFKGFTSENINSEP